MSLGPLNRNDMLGRRNEGILPTQDYIANGEGNILNTRTSWSANTSCNPAAHMVFAHPFSAPECGL